MCVGHDGAGAPRPAYCGVLLRNAAVAVPRSAPRRAHRGVLPPPRRRAPCRTAPVSSCDARPVGMRPGGARAPPSPSPHWPPCPWAPWRRHRHLRRPAAKFSGGSRPGPPRRRPSDDGPHACARRSLLLRLPQRGGHRRPHPSGSGVPLAQRRGATAAAVSGISRGRRLRDRPGSAAAPSRSAAGAAAAAARGISRGRRPAPVPASVLSLPLPPGAGALASSYVDASARASAGRSLLCRLPWDLSRPAPPRPSRPPSLPCRLPRAPAPPSPRTSLRPRWQPPPCLHWRRPPPRRSPSPPLLPRHLPSHGGPCTEAGGGTLYLLCSGGRLRARLGSGSLPALPLRANRLIAARPLPVLALRGGSPLLPRHRRPRLVRGARLPLPLLPRLRRPVL